MKEKRDNIVYQLIEKLKDKAIKKAQKKYKNDKTNLELALSFIEKTVRHSKNLHKAIEGLISLNNLTEKELAEMQYPHDLVGPGNKFNLDIMHVMMQKKTLADFSEKEKAIMRKHRDLQYHHHLITMNNPDKIDLQIWALDIALAWKEKRGYKKSFSIVEVYDNIALMSKKLDKSKIIALKWAVKKIYNKHIRRVKL